MYLSNLTFIEDGNPTFVDDTDVINLGKFRMVTRSIDEVDKLQLMTYVDLLDGDPIVRNVIKFGQKLDSEAQYEKSLQCEASNRKPTVTVTIDEFVPPRPPPLEEGDPDRVCRDKGSGISSSTSMMTMSSAASEAAAGMLILFLPALPVRNLTFVARKEMLANRREAFQNRSGGLRAGQRSQTDFNLVHYTSEPAPQPPGPPAPLPANEI